MKQVLLLLCLALAASGFGDDADGEVSYNPRGETTVDSSQYDVSYARKPTEYPDGYNPNPVVVVPVTPVAPVTAAPVTPYAPTAAMVPAPSIGHVQPYSELEYGQILLQASQDRIEPTGARPTKTSILDQINLETLGTEPKIVEGLVTEVFDRGILLLNTGEELKLRGVDIPTQRTLDEMKGFYAGQAISFLSQVARGQNVKIAVQDPLRDTAGNLIGTVYLSDGTQLNQLVLEQGLGNLDETEFPTNSTTLETLRLAKDNAVASKVGVWSIQFQ